MGIESLISRHGVTSETAPETLPFQPEAIQGAGCTSETAETWEFDKSGIQSSGAVTCADCRHAIPAAFHSMLVDCAQGVDSGNPTRHRWKSDRHRCGDFSTARRVKNDVGIIGNNPDLTLKPA
jgi:hypothetical protein